MSVTLILLWLAGSPQVQVTQFSSMTRCEAAAQQIRDWAAERDTRLLAVCSLQ